MLKLEQIHVLRYKVLVEGQSVRQVARQMGLSRNTVKKYLRAEAPARRAARPRPVLDRVRARLEELLRGATAGPPSATRLHRQLTAEGHAVGPTLVRGFLRQRRPPRVPAGD